MQNKHTYIADVKKILPESYCATELVDAFYSKQKYGHKTNQMIQRVSRQFKIARRPCVLNLKEYPNHVLKKETDHPLNWGTQIINQLTATIDKADIGFFSLSYNISFHKDTLPNLATQMALSADLTAIDQVEEIPNYGCAASIYSIENAIAYCKKHDRAALVFTFDQCFAKSMEVEKSDEDFRKMMVSNLIFSDGGVGLLIIPERMTKNFNHPLIKIKDSTTKYKMGNLIHMKKERFLMNSNVKNIMPHLVSDLLLKPFLKKHMLRTDEIHEWAMHQGGSAVIKEFCKDEVLGLTPEQIERSLNKFYQYGNTSSASCLIVLESFFNEKSNKNQSIKGVLLGFGAGYYLGALLYEWSNHHLTAQKLPLKTAV